LATTDSMNMENVYICILAGGSGTRLWPLSRRQMPKQLLNLTGERSMLQQTIDRVLPLVPPERILILTNPERTETIAEHVPNIPRENILCEPSARGTAPALGLAAFRLRHRMAGDTVMVSLHADHTIAYPERLHTALRTAVATARQGYLVTIGVVPKYAETGYGYIQRGLPLAQGEMPVYRIAQFREKPSREVAEAYLASGLYDWNTGYFTWRLDAIIEAFRAYQPAIHAQLSNIIAAADSSEADDVLANTWEHIERTSIDVGIMEKAVNAAVVSCDLGWNDVGSWASLYDILPRDGNGNVVFGGGEHLELDTQGSLIFSSKRLVVCLGIQDLVVVDAEDALLVLPRERAQQVSDIVKLLQQQHRDQYL